MNDATRKRRDLHDGLTRDRAMVLVGAHDAMSAKLIGDFDFDGVWLSGLGVSTMAHAMPDLNLITMSETLEAAVRMDRATSLPVVVDCDNGFGAAANVVRTVREFEAAGIAGICIEDNLFPKRNSLFQGDTRRELIPVAEQARRIRLAKQAQADEAFVVIARVEALIAGHGVEAACERADAYAAAGADAVLIHSKDPSLQQIEGFLAQWRGLGRTPLVAVPTLFPDHTSDELHAKGFQVVILANQPMRAAVKAMEDTLRVLRKQGRAADVDPEIATVSHVFDLVATTETMALDDQPT